MRVRQTARMRRTPTGTPKPARTTVPVGTPELQRIRAAAAPIGTPKLARMSRPPTGTAVLPRMRVLPRGTPKLARML
eukprot:7873464-Prorocentrum_lima.AAC.1